MGNVQRRLVKETIIRKPEPRKVSIIDITQKEDFTSLFENTNLK